MRFTWLRHGLVAIVTLAILAGCTSALGTGDPTLDLETLQVNVSEGTAKAEPVPNTYVGQVEENLFIAVAIPESDSKYGPDQTIVYLCDGDSIAEWMTGQQAPEVALTSGDIEVELAFTVEEVSGTVTLADGEPIPFTAERASGNAGLYRAEGSFGDKGYTGIWVVLPDERQRGWWQYKEEDERFRV